MPSSARMVVVLPEPLLPRKPNVSPRSMSNDRSRITVVRPKSMRKFAMWTSGVVVAAVGALTAVSLGERVEQGRVDGPIRRQRRSVAGPRGAVDGRERAARLLDDRDQRGQVVG